MAFIKGKALLVVLTLLAFTVTSTILPATALAAANVPPADFPALAESTRVLTRWGPQLVYFNDKFNYKVQFRVDLHDENTPKARVHAVLEVYKYRKYSGGEVLEPGWPHKYHSPTVQFAKLPQLVAGLWRFIQRVPIILFINPDPLPQRELQIAWDDAMRGIG